MTREPRRLCIVSPSTHGGGAEYQIGLLVDALWRAGTFELFFLARHAPPQGEQGYRLVRIGHSRRVPRFGYLMDGIPLYRALAAVRPAIVYQRVGGGYTGICALYARRRHIPLVWHVAHDTDVSPFTLDTGRNGLRRWLEKSSLEFGLRHADHIIVQTQHQGRLLSDHYGRTADALIPNYAATPSNVPAKDERPLIIWVANLKQWKRPEIFVRLARALSHFRDAQFLMVGEPPGAAPGPVWFQDLQHAIAATPNLRYLGYCDQAQVEALMDRACMFVNTSVHEGFPNTFIQAWMRDTVVVSLSVDPDGVLERERVGIHAGSEPALVQAVDSLLRHPTHRALLIERARQHVRTVHSLANAETLVGLLTQWAQPNAAIAAASFAASPRTVSSGH
jgi:glycosyltransferase involved in cell wall biosynthesis